MTTIGDTNDRWVRRFHPTPTATARLLCLPHAGGSASYFFPVSRRLAPGIEALAVQYPGRQDRLGEKSIESVEELADRLVDVVLPFRDKPLGLFGHSLGALVAFELALRLEERGVVPVGLFASGRRAPVTVRQGEDAHLRSDDELIAAVRQLGGTSTSLLDDKQIMAMVLPSIRADYRAAETYRHRPGPRLATPVYAFLGDADPKVTVPEAERWAEHTEGGFDLTVYPGGHFYLNSHADAVMDRIAAQLTDKVPAGG
ncbi:MULTISPECIES: thioesterase II family protein [Actinoalloteichus]|uniref:Cadicidin biosynthesis thioesterase n=1 Tax=Actinoalloteichus fjordicus TaxID=1612552 RepID=A0AAC9PSF5_9PSEU|nr:MULTISPECIES: alpha/beta fold hydrolase [Actinoalloteichus]APU14947.1 putative cadicidin biosynthesis thioesterase [Actinoalloteichus fjordicus]APU21017.1 putative cadicidin biosynthesis thioesterase [Actinoalloteichus sp. GBA129-24]